MSWQPGALGLRQRRNVWRRYSEELLTFHGRSAHERTYGAGNQVAVLLTERGGPIEQA